MMCLLRTVRPIGTLTLFAPPRVRHARWPIAGITIGAWAGNRTWVINFGRSTVAIMRANRRFDDVDLDSLSADVPQNTRSRRGRIARLCVPTRHF